MARFTFLTIACTVLCGVFVNSATDCPYCIGVIDCAADQTIPTVPCTADLVNRTVAQLNTIFINLTEYTIPATNYSCIKVEFAPSKDSYNTFEVRGCTSGTKSICQEPTLGFNGVLRCNSYSGGQSLHDTGHNVLTGLLLNIAVLISAFGLSS